MLEPGGSMVSKSLILPSCPSCCAIESLADIFSHGLLGLPESWASCGLLTYRPSWVNTISVGPVQAISVCAMSSWHFMEPRLWMAPVPSKDTVTVFFSLMLDFAELTSDEMSLNEEPEFSVCCCPALSGAAGDPPWLQAPRVIANAAADRATAVRRTGIPLWMKIAMPQKVRACW
ncbi:hypothetical protein [Saccharopolyspora hattusasensis]|uniref:hypothetical protein n=1 Tax=Saccharopolyspora hattusasensis TaxID=1128679 RepID=UPI003D962044